MLDILSVNNGIKLLIMCYIGSLSYNMVLFCFVLKSKFQKYLCSRFLYASFMFPFVLHFCLLSLCLPTALTFSFIQNKTMDKHKIMDEKHLSFFLVSKKKQKDQLKLCSIDLFFIQTAWSIV